MELYPPKTLAIVPLLLFDDVVVKRLDLARVDGYYGIVNFVRAIVLGLEGLGYSIYARLRPVDEVILSSNSTGTAATAAPYDNPSAVPLAIVFTVISC